MEWNHTCPVFASANNFGTDFRFKTLLYQIILFTKISPLSEFTLPLKLHTYCAPVGSANPTFTCRY